MQKRDIFLTKKFNFINNLKAKFINKIKKGDGLVDGSKIRRIRRMQDITLDELSKRTGLAKSTISMIENSRRSPTGDTLTKLAKGLGVTITELFTEEG